MLKNLLLVAVVILIGLAGCRLIDGLTVTYEITITVDPSSPTPIAPVAWAVHSGPNPFFDLGTSDRLPGLEALAEDGDPSGAAAALEAHPEVQSSGVVSIPDGASGPGAAGPGDSYSFIIEMDEDDRLSFATMYVQSNDLFFSPDSIGITILDLAGSHVITDKTFLYDAGTEVNQEPGMGSNQAPRQGGPNTGPDENGVVSLIADVADGFVYPAIEDVVRVTITIE